MWLGTAIGRLWAWWFQGDRLSGMHDDPTVEVWEVPRLIPRWAIGQAWGNIILVTPVAWRHPDRARLLAHEYCHVLQWRRYGSVFAFLYIWACLAAFLRHGPGKAYSMNTFECEARRAAAENALGSSADSSD